MLEQNAMLDVMNNFYLSQETRYYIGEGDEPIWITENLGISIHIGEKLIHQLYIIVEMYDHKKYGKLKRRWLTEFTDAERKLISKWYLKLYAWYLRTGAPVNGVSMRIETYKLLTRVAKFFYES